jgi:DNA polymerase III sliding clamp (beta) subunit (PCNA family)
MKLTISATEALRLAKLLKPIVPARAMLPVIGQILFDLDHEGQPRVSATDLDRTVIAPLAFGYTLERGDGALPYVAVRFAEFAEAARTADKDSDVILERSGHKRTEIQHTRLGVAFDQTLRTCELAEFPELNIQGFTIGFWMPSGLVQSIQGALDFVSTDATRYILNGVYLEGGDNGAVVATDGRRLAAYSASVPIPASFVIPTDSAAYLNTHTTEGPCWLQTSGTAEDRTVEKVMVRMDQSALFVFRPVAGNYPNYRQVIPTIEGASCATLDPVKQDNVTKLLCSVKPKLDLNTELLLTADGECHWRLSRPKSDNGSTNDRWPAWGPQSLVGTALHSGPAFTAAFNARFLGDALAAAGPGAKLWLRDSTSPLLITKADGTYRQVLMPMRTNTQDTEVKASASVAGAPVE